MDPSRDHRILIHEDQALFREAVLFTAGQTGLNATLIEKDYFCTVLLQYLYQQPDSPLIFRGDTCIGKVYADFYRLSEDLDFMISTPPEANISVRRKRMAPVREWVRKISEKMSILTLPEDFTGHNSSRQYVAYVTYPSVFLTEETARIKIEMGLRETPLMPPAQMKARTLLLNPFTRKSMVPDIDLITLPMKEAIAEKIRAALTRLEPAIRDFFDIDYLASRNKMDLNDRHLFQLVAGKLKIPGNLPVDLSSARKEKLKTQINTELKPVLRPVDFESFDLSRAFDIVARMSHLLE
ncbi:MAG: nucleotidyl transferase AbiEii/AbiGii toxin family protein [Syntrophobacterales bacterium]|nr:nucleotidyl transferase AbiEii/AbiGii toxin family protein [Syntrophobacterales bacterium]